MALLDSSRRHIDVNAATLQLLGYTREHMIGRPVSEFVARGRSLMSADQWEAAMAAGRFSGNARLLAADGSEVAVQYAATTEVITGRRLTLLVELSRSRWAGAFAVRCSATPASRSHRREQEIVRLVALGMTAREIAVELHITHHTVRTHVRNAMRKTGARSRAHLVAKALADGVALGEPDGELATGDEARTSSDAA